MTSSMRDYPAPSYLLQKTRFGGADYLFWRSRSAPGRTNRARRSIVVSMFRGLPAERDDTLLTMI